jgi:hypothetical protein
MKKPSPATDLLALSRFWVFAVFEGGQLSRLMVLWLTLYDRAISVSTSPASRRAICQTDGAADAFGHQETACSLAGEPNNNIHSE